MKTLGIIILVLVGLVTVINLSMSSEKSALYDQLHEAERICGTAMDDAALGGERRRTREICDRLITSIKAEIKVTP
jgi:type II secretory pathway pseudopilin PulG